MKHFVARLFVFLIFLLIVTDLLSYLLDIHFGENFVGTKSNWILRKRNNHYSFAALGSSRVYNMIDIIRMEAATGQSGINLGTSGSGYAENYLLLEKFSRTNTIDHLILNIDAYSLNSAKSFSYPFHDFEFLPFFSDDSVNQTFRDTEGYRYYLWSIVPFAKYVEFNSSFNVLTIREGDDSFYRELDSSRGYRPRREVADAIKDGTRAERRKSLQKGIDAIDKKYFLKILNLCGVRNIHVILITTPIQQLDTTGASDTFIRETANQYNLHYIPFADVGDFSDAGLFEDQSHTSRKGTLYYSERLGSVLKSRGEI